MIEFGQPLRDRQGAERNKQYDYQNSDADPLPRNRFCPSTVFAVGTSIIHGFGTCFFTPESLTLGLSAKTALRRTPARPFGSAPARKRQVNERSDNVVVTTPSRRKRREEV